MNDIGLADDQIKLVAYTIVFVKPGQEQIMPGGEGTMIVTDNLTDEQFAAWIIAQYMQLPAAKAKYGDVVRSAADAKYLRVHYAVPRRWPKERFLVETRQSDALERVWERFDQR